ncbi:MAG: hypothetical protein R3B90_17115 [Planctomycetaceae bacterium]
MLHTDGQLEMVELRSGERRELGKLPTTLPGRHQWHNVQLVSDSQWAYLLIDTEFDSSVMQFSAPTARFNGFLVGCDLEHGTIAWSAKIEKQQLLLLGLEHSPVLALINQSNVGTLYELDVRLLDKTTGTELFAAKERLSNAPLNTIHFDLVRRVISLGTYNLTLELRPKRVRAEPTENME